MATSSTLNIAALAQRTGVAADTIRKWEQRYGVLHPERTSGGQRRYSELDVSRVKWLRARLGEGYRIGEASALLGSADLVTADTPEELRRAVVQAVTTNDVSGLSRVVQHALSLNQLEEALADVIAPAFAEIGEAWASGELSAAQEHLASGVVRAHLERLLADERGDVLGTAVLACAPGERHELGLLMLAVLLRADGWQVAFLGADTPVADAARLAASLHARVLAISATMPDTARSVEAALDDADVPLHLHVVVGGNALNGEAARRLGLRALNSDLRRTIGEIRKLSE